MPQFLLSPILASQSRVSPLDTRILPTELSARWAELPAPGVLRSDSMVRRALLGDKVLSGGSQCKSTGVRTLR